MRWTILIGGKAGKGPNALAKIVSEALLDKGYFVFYTRDYQSLIRGGHNFNVITFSQDCVFSNDSQVDVLVAFDDMTLNIHKKELKKNSITIKDGENNMYYAGRIFKLLGIDFTTLEKKLKNFSNFDENIENAKKGFEEQNQKLEIPNPKKQNAYFIDGNIGISEGAVESGLDFYYAYPMTPATGVLTNLAQMSVNGKHLTIELENEIAVANAAIGSAITGSRAMVGTSGGGFDLMTESLSLTGIAEIPMIFYLSMRPGPSTGVATYTGQGDLKLALGGGHGEFPRIVVAPGEPKEAKELTSQLFYLSQKLKTPTILLGDKHLAESFYTLTEKAKLIKPAKTIKLQRFNSYEKGEEGIATEDSEVINKNVESRMKKKKEIEKEVQKFETYKTYGKKNSKNVIVSWGSTKGAILDSINDFDVRFVQILYLEPFAKIDKEIKGKNVIVIENNATSPLADLISEKTGIYVKNKILRYDGRPFLADELKKEIKRFLK